PIWISINCAYICENRSVVKELIHVGADEGHNVWTIVIENFYRVKFLVRRHVIKRVKLCVYDCPQRTKFAVFAKAAFSELFLYHVVAWGCCQKNLKSEE